jgi:hypothetical protein
MDEMDKAVVSATVQHVCTVIRGTVVTVKSTVGTVRSHPLNLDQMVDLSSERCRYSVQIQRG